ncbi:MAG TPA: SprT-like domain-containing protein [Pyrinomonadaceae bacterium]|nr:SprT-like domain-containing protein [Pyrinomonadaceae bacterium]
MPHSELDLRRAFEEAFRELGASSKRLRPAITAIEVRFYPYAGLHHTIRVRSGRIFVRISDLFRSAPSEVIRALAFLLVARLLSRKPRRDHEQLYRSYAFSPEVLRASDLARRQRGRKIVSTATGRVYDLNRIFLRVNRRYFDGQIEKPTLTWSQRRTRSILGHHDAAHETITISKTLDSHDVPEWFVEYIMFHEMLHIKHPARLINGRRYYHTPAFRAEEKAYPRYEQAQEWLDRVIRTRKVLRARAA